MSALLPNVVFRVTSDYDICM